MQTFMTLINNIIHGCDHKRPKIPTASWQEFTVGTFKRHFRTARPAPLLYPEYAGTGSSKVWWHVARAAHAPQAQRTEASFLDHKSLDHLGLDQWRPCCCCCCCCCCENPTQTILHHRSRHKRGLTVNHCLPHTGRKLISNSSLPTR